MRTFAPQFQRGQLKAGPSYSPGQMRRYVAAFERSGLSVAAFARQQGFSSYLLRSWLQRAQSMAKRRANSFQSVPLGSLLGPSWAAEVVGPTGVTVRLSAQAPPSLAMQLVALTCRV